MSLPEPSKRGRRALSEWARDRFLELLADGYSVTHAANEAGVHRQRLYEARDHDREFFDSWAAAFDAGTDRLRDHLRKLAVEGVDEPLVSAGKIVGTKRVYDGKLLLAELKRRDSSYRDQGPQAVAINISATQNVQRGVSMSEVAAVLLKAGVDLPALAARHELEAGELIAETDEPADEESKA